MLLLTGEIKPVNWVKEGKLSGPPKYLWQALCQSNTSKQEYVQITLSSMPFNLYDVYNPNWAPSLKLVITETFQDEVAA